MEKIYQLADEFTTYSDLGHTHGSVGLNVTLPNGSLGQTYLISAQAWIISVVNGIPDLHVSVSGHGAETLVVADNHLSLMVRLLPGGGSPPQLTVDVSGYTPGTTASGAVVGVFIAVVPVG